MYDATVLTKLMLGVVLVPSTSTGASGFTRDVPRIMIFRRPERKAGDELQGIVGEKANGNETYLSIFGKVYDDIEKPLGKHVAKPDRPEFVSNVPALSEEEAPFLYTRTDSGACRSSNFSSSMHTLILGQRQRTSCPQACSTVSVMHSYICLSSRLRRQD